MKLPLLPMTALLFLGALTVAVSAGGGQRAHAGAAAPKAGGFTPSRPAPAGALPPLPTVAYAPPRPMAVVRQVYEFAARHPEVLQHVPCYCGCERGGHQGNHDCFVKSRAANGRITEWDTHGLGCTICIDVARDAMTMFENGASVSAIRTAIDAKYAPHFPSATPTPRPPAARK